MDGVNQARRGLWLATALALALGPALAAADADAPGANGLVPGLSEAGQKKYRDYLTFPKPRAFAIARDGHYGLASGTVPRDPSLPTDPTLRALEVCRRLAKAECTLYSVDDQVVYREPAPPAAPPPAAAPVPVEPSIAQLAAEPEVAPAPAATDSPLPLTWVVEVTGDRGFNDLYTIRYQDSGSSQSKNWTVPANTGLGCSVGVLFLPLAEGRLRTQATLGFKATAQSFSNAEVVYYGFPVEVIETVQLDKVRLGAGLYLLLGAKLSGSGGLSSLQQSFDPSPGFTVRGEWMLSSWTSVGVHWIWNRLAANGQSMSAPALGVFVALNGNLAR
jgi:hypothetical protein